MQMTSDRYTVIFSCCDFPYTPLRDVTIKLPLCSFPTDNLPACQSASLEHSPIHRSWDPGGDLERICWAVTHLHLPSGEGFWVPCCFLLCLHGSLITILFSGLQNHSCPVRFARNPADMVFPGRLWTLLAPNLGLTATSDDSAVATDVPFLTWI